ncbi:MAG: polysaccharide biosynthesis/export family protein [Sedimentisphaerales bacterium]|nr:polysaccharide biosynthesis/export family protein [Sedimentisphaerales bacterium]
MQFTVVSLRVVLLTFLVSLAGCFSSNPKNIEAFIKPAQIDVTSDGYVLQPPDVVEIYCTKVPEVHGQSQQIRPDGIVTFEVLGEIQAAGKTPKQLAELLRERIMLLYDLAGEHPVDVRITAYESKVYYVLGQVYFRGTQEYTGRDTVLTALARARPTTLAWEERVQVVRPSADKSVKPKIFEVNYDRMVAHGDTSKNVLLQEGDIVYVPPTILAAIGLVVEEIVSPIGRAFSTVNIMQGPPERR